MSRKHHEYRRKPRVVLTDSDELEIVCLCPVDQPRSQRLDGRLVGLVHQSVAL